MQIPLAMEGFGEEEIETIVKVFRSGNLTMGEHVREFENSFAGYFGSSHAVMVNSGSSANILALEAQIRGRSGFSVDVKQYIAVPGVLWPTSLWPIIQLGFEVLIIDTKPNTLEIDFNELRKAKSELGKSLVGAVVIHPLGKSLDLEEIRSVQEELKMFVIEDNCESMGAGQGKSYAGSIGDFGTFSFYFSHHITTVEGGMVLTNNAEIADDLRSMRAHGWTRNRTDREKFSKNNPDLHKDFLFVTSGYNFRPMEFQGAVGKIQLSKLNSFVRRRLENANRVSKAIIGETIELIDSKSIESDLQKLNSSDQSSVPVSNSWMALPIRNLNPKMPISELHNELNVMGIDTRPLLAGDFTSQPAGRNPKIKKFGPLINASTLYKSSLMIGNHHNLSEEQMNHLENALGNLR